MINEISLAYASVHTISTFCASTSVYTKHACDAPALYHLALMATPLQRLVCIYQVLHNNVTGAYGLKSLKALQATYH